MTRHVTGHVILLEVEVGVEKALVENTVYCLGREDACLLLITALCKATRGSNGDRYQSYNASTMVCTTVASPAV